MRSSLLSLAAPNSSIARALLALLAALVLAAAADAQPRPPCNPCAGVRLAAPPDAAFAEALAAGPAVDAETMRLYVHWTTTLDDPAAPSRVPADFARVAAAGGTPWLTLVLQTPTPVLEHLDALEVELEQIAAIAAAAGPRAHLQLAWRPSNAADAAIDAEQLAFVIKRAAVAITGRQSDARVIVGPLPADVALLGTLYDEDIAAYADGLALAPSADAAITAAIQTVATRDPGKPVLLDALAWPGDPLRVLPRAAEMAVAGVGVVFFDLPAARAADATALAPFKLLAREFSGDLSHDPYAKVSGGDGAWVFVRGEDLGLRVILDLPDPGDAIDTGGLVPVRRAPVMVTFEDPQLRAPSFVDPATGDATVAFGQRRLKAGLMVPAETPARAAVVRLERTSVIETEGGVEEQLTVDDARQMPVEEILRRLQAFEDAQARKLDHYQAINTQHLRFRLGDGLETLEVTFRGNFFFRQDEGFDWAWEELFINGVRWRSKKLPEIPLIQPEKAATLPLTINFNQRYRYRLRGTETIETARGARDCWVIDFTPIDPQPGEALYRGSVWVDREHFARVRTRALQVGLEGEVISNEETIFFSPIDIDGAPTEWGPDAYVLPLRTVGQQLLSVLNATTQVERETLLTGVQLNGPGFDDARAAMEESDATMVRDTEVGLRYLVKNEEGEREVKMALDRDRLFALGGVFYDDSLDFPVPLAGVNYLSLDFRGSGNQVNVFFGGALLIANAAEPRLFDSKWDAGINLFGFFIPLGEELFRDGEESPEEEIEGRPLELSLFLGRPLGAFTKLDFTYELEYDSYDTADDTASDFVLPTDTFTHNLGVELTYNRSGWRLNGEFIASWRSDWEFWGLPGNTEFDQEQEDFFRWKVSAAKTWWLPRFTKFGVEVERLDGEDLDRFSKWDFSFFGDSRVSGYANGQVTATEANGLHLSYGLELGEVIRVTLNGDAVWATDEDTGLDDELLAGIGVNGTLIGPWNTIVNFDVGVPLEGPADGVVAYIVFLKLFG